MPTEGIGGPAGRPKPGKPRVTDDVAIVLATLEPPPARLGTHGRAGCRPPSWACRTSRRRRCGGSTGCSPGGGKPSSSPPTRSWRPRSATSPACTNPPDKAVVLCIDEKSQVQALERTAPVLPLRPGIPEKATHDYVRHGTTTLFAALETATGKVTSAGHPRHRHEEFLSFLRQVAKTYPRRQLHIVTDNYGITDTRT